MFKNNKACAVAITINLDGEYFWLSQFPDSVNKPKTLSMGTYGLHRGLYRLLDVLARYELTATFFIPGAIAEKYPAQMKDIAQQGHEIASHGHLHENFALLSVEEQKKALLASNNAIESSCGILPAGFRAPEGELTADTQRLLAELGFLYSSSLYNEDCPYVVKPSGTNKSFIEIPVKWQLFDFPYFAFNYGPAFPAGQGRISNYTKVLENWKLEYDGAARYGLSYILQLDPQTIGTPGRINLLEELLDYILSKEDACFCTCRQLAEATVPL